MADKNSPSPTDGLNQKFRIVIDDNGRKKVDVIELSDIEKNQKILAKITVDHFMEIFHSQTFTNKRSFSDEIRYLLGEQEMQTVEWGWIFEAGGTMYNVVNAYTKASQYDGLPADSAHKLQRVGGQILGMLKAN